MRAEHEDILKSKKVADQRHRTNKEALAEKYQSCLEHWSQIVKKFEAFYAFEVRELKYVNDWLGNPREGGTLKEIKQAIGTGAEASRCAKEDFVSLRERYLRYKRRIEVAHESKKYPDTFADDKAQRDRLKNKLSEAFKDKNAMREAMDFLYARRNELRGYVERVRPLHPDAPIDAICETLNFDREFNSRKAFGISTKKQKIAYLESKRDRIENAAAN